MKCCAFGTIRVDIHAYQDLKKLENSEEVKTNKMSMAVGGSVYNTASILHELGCAPVLYALDMNDPFADLVKLKLEKQQMEYVFNEKDVNSTAVTLIFLDDEGKKKMVSYDGEREDAYVLQDLLEDIAQYDLFYTSFYEINKNNSHDILEIMSLSKMNFIDLSPLIYSVPKHIINDVLVHTHILSGTTDELEYLIGLLGVESYAELIETYKLKYVFQKDGSRGAILHTRNQTFSCEPKRKRHSSNTTGCGDSFNAGVIDAMINNLDDEHILEQAVETATFVAYEGLDFEKVASFVCQLEFSDN